MLKIYPFLLPIILVLMLGSCRSLRSTDMFRTSSDFEYQEFNANQSSSERILLPNDRITLMMSTNSGHSLLESGMFYEGKANVGNMAQNRLHVDYLIESDSLVKLPTLGRVKLGGLTVKQAEEQLENMLSEHYQNPFVKLNVVNRKVLLFFEEGTKAQVVNLPDENITLIEVLADAGGLSPNSKSYRIKLLRGDSQNPKVFRYNLSTLKDYRKADLVLQANDIIYVESRPRYISKALRDLQPFFTMTTTLILLYTTITNFVEKQ